MLYGPLKNAPPATRLLVQIIGKDRVALSPEEFSLRLEGYSRIVLDLGTGDGVFVIDQARQSPEAFFIGIDAAADNLAEVSRKAERKISRGGARNCLFLCAATESLPAALAGIADELYINYPWGSLLMGVIVPNASTLAAIASLLKPGGVIHLLVNYSVLSDDDLCKRLNLPLLTSITDTDYLVPSYESCGLRITRRDLLPGEPSYRTSWGRRLFRGSLRQTLAIDGVKD